MNHPTRANPRTIGLPAICRCGKTWSVPNLQFTAVLAMLLWNREAKEGGFLMFMSA